jgi:DNA-binding transcriptional ArsR family regulator
MTQIVFIGRSTPEPEVLAALHRRGYTLVLAPQAPANDHTTHAQLLIIGMESDAQSGRAPFRLQRRRMPWLAWNRSDDQALTLLAYAAGAAAVLPRDTTADLLVQLVESFAGPPVQTPAITMGAAQHRFRRGSTIRLAPDSLLEIGRGIVTQSMLHEDGSAVLLGLYGPGRVLTGHPHDDCAVEFVAHTDVIAAMRQWSDALRDAEIVERLRERIQLMEAWAAIQARPHLDQRILGLLALIAEQFGIVCGDDTIVDVRLTHTQLAAAVGATRPTVTRIIGDLRTRGLLTTVGDGERERFRLRGRRPSTHLRAAPAEERRRDHTRAEQRSMAAAVEPQ